MNWPNHILCKCFLLFLLLGIGNSPLLAQDGQNPFEIPNREAAPRAETPSTPVADNPFDLQENPERRSAETPAVGTPQVEVARDTAANPFDLQSAPPTITSPGNIPGLSPEENPFEIERLNTDSKSSKKVAPSPVLQPQRGNPLTSDRNFLFTISLILIVFLAFLITLYRSTVVQIYRAFLNDNILKLKQREQGGFLNLSLILLYTSSFLNAGFFGYLIFKNLGEPIQDHWKILLFCTLGVSSIFLLKHIVLRVLGLIFPMDKELRQYSFTIVVFNIILGILLLPFNLLIAFGPQGLPKLLVYSFLGISALIYCFRFMRSLLIASRHISSNKFHFFMYLCTVEIAPTLVLVKLLLMIQDGV